MQTYATTLLEISLEASDGLIGKVKDIYFDDDTWEVRYLIVETGNWLFQRRVLIAPCALQETTDISANILPVNLTRMQIKESPNIDSDMPVSRQQELSLFNHYSWPGYGGIIVSDHSRYIGNQNLKNNNNYDLNLRSFKHISDYEVHNSNGMVGRTKDLMIDLSSWKIEYLLFDDVFTSDQEMVVLDKNKINSISWDDNCIKISLNDDELRSAPIINAKDFFSDKIDYPPFT
ncbi:PRC-barrel domain-containing protein [Pedobacter terrae]|uniref:PRC-barrel domain-containing protein n=1 Tax=Pedobacter terrae TaxID=405671 RepID=A0A1G8ACG1_9SPHI|nr:PRC-barrel domain-containing protein [Pedobacter terrae]SDH18715.1 PRC-barrel domain-containing protein [Pedobacter terrae]